MLCNKFFAKTHIYDLTGECVKLHITLLDYTTIPNKYYCDNKNSDPERWPYILRLTLIATRYNDTRYPCIPPYTNIFTDSPKCDN